MVFLFCHASIKSATERLTLLNFLNDFCFHDLFWEVKLGLTLHKETYSGLNAFVIEVFARKNVYWNLGLALKHELEWVSRNQNTQFWLILKLMTNSTNKDNCEAFLSKQFFTSSNTRDSVSWPY